jgi:hypothetical protein
MRCYYHQEQEAVALCKSCSRGLCPSCAVDVGNGLACRNSCEDEVRSLNRVINRNKTSYEKTSGAYARMAVFYGVLGAVMFVGGVFDWRGFQWLLMPAGAIFLLSGVLHYTTGRRFQKE